MAFDIKGFRENVKRREAEQAAAMAARDTSRQKPPPRDPPPPKPSWRDQTIMAQDLCDKTYPAVSYVVPGLFPEGVILLVSRPKLGKSWLLQQIGSSVALGNPVLASPVEPDKPAHGDVLYLNLEDGEKRAQRRMTKHFGMRRESWPQRMRIARAWRRLDLGGLGDLCEWCKSVEKPTLIMIDTLKRVRPPKRHGQTDYDADYEACQGLLDLAREFPGLVIIVAHHDRKMGADDVFDTVSGTLGLTGGVDTIAILKRSGQGVTLHIQGRDLVDDVEKAVAFDRETCRWTILGEAADIQRSDQRTRVLDALREGPPEGMTASEIRGAAGLRSRDDALWQLLHRMAKAGEIERRNRGKYALPGTPLSGVSGSQEGRQSIDETRLNSVHDTPDTPDRGSKVSNPEAPNSAPDDDIPFFLDRRNGRQPDWLKPRLGPPAISAGPDDDLADLDGGWR